VRSKAAMGARSPVVGGGRGETREGFCYRMRPAGEENSGGGYEITLAFRWIGWMDGTLGRDREFEMAPSLLLCFLDSGRGVERLSSTLGSRPKEPTAIA